MAKRAGLVLQGTCGWNGFPTNGRSYEDKLVIYARNFPCVEVDSSCYAIPRPETTRKWAQQVPAGFVFHFKAFGLFTHQSAQVNTLPAEVRACLPEVLRSSATAHVPLSQLRECGGEQAAWDAFHAALEPVIQAGKMGCVVFQFQLGFKPGQAQQEYVRRCRRMLRADVPMAVELRNRDWFADAAAATRLASWMAEHGICLVSADELKHETYQKDREQRGLPPGQVRELMPIALHVTCPDYHYVRLHRRHGTRERVLQAEEFEAWSRRLSALSPHVPRGPIYFLWGTEWEDACLVNARALTAALPPSLRYDYKAALQQAAARRPGSILALLGGSGGGAGSGRGAAGSAAGRAAAAFEEAAAAGPPAAAGSAAAVKDGDGLRSTAAAGTACAAARSSAAGDRDPDVGASRLSAAQELLQATDQDASCEPEPGHGALRAAAAAQPEHLRAFGSHTCGRPVAGAQVAWLQGDSTTELRPQHDLTHQQQHEHQLWHPRQCQERQDPCSVHHLQQGFNPQEDGQYARHRHHQHQHLHHQQHQHQWQAAQQEQGSQQHRGQEPQQQGLLPPAHSPHQQQQGRPAGEFAAAAAGCGCQQQPAEPSAPVAALNDGADAGGGARPPKKQRTAGPGNSSSSGGGNQRPPGSSRGSGKTRPLTFYFGKG